MSNNQKDAANTNKDKAQNKGLFGNINFTNNSASGLFGNSGLFTNPNPNNAPFSFSLMGAPDKNKASDAPTQNKSSGLFGSNNINNPTSSLFGNPSTNINPLGFFNQNQNQKQPQEIDSNKREPKVQLPKSTNPIGLFDNKSSNNLPLPSIFGSSNNPDSNNGSLLNKNAEKSNLFGNGGTSGLFGNTKKDQKVQEPASGNKSLFSNTSSDLFKKTTQNGDKKEAPITEAKQLNPQNIHPTNKFIQNKSLPVIKQQSFSSLFSQPNTKEIPKNAPTSSLFGSNTSSLFTNAQPQTNVNSSLFGPSSFGQKKQTTIEKKQQIQNKAKIDQKDSVKKTDTGFMGLFGSTQLPATNTGGPNSNQNLKNQTKLINQTKNDKKVQSSLFNNNNSSLFSGLSGNNASKQQPIASSSNPEQSSLFPSFKAPENKTQSVDKKQETNINFLNQTFASGSSNKTPSFGQGSLAESNIQSQNQLIQQVPKVAAPQSSLFGSESLFSFNKNNKETEKLISVEKNISLKTNQERKQAEINVNALVDKNKPQIPLKINTTEATQKNSLNQPQKLSQPKSIFQTSQKKNKEQIITYKKYKEQEKSKSKFEFTQFLQQMKIPIINSIKLHFTCRKNQFKEVKTIPSQNLKDVQKFYEDLTNTIMKISGFDEKVEKSNDLIKLLIKEVVLSERYNNYLFENNGTELNKAYMTENKIYWLDYNNKFVLNVKTSKELLTLIKIILTNIFSYQISFLNILTKNSNLISAPSDLFEYLLIYLLNLQKKKLQCENEQLLELILEFDIKMKKKIVDLLEQINKKVHKSHHLIKNEKISEIIILIDENIENDIVQLSLKILLYTFELNNDKKLNSDVLKVIEKTTSLGLLPFRSIICKLSKNSKIQQVTPLTSDLFKYINGDQWLDWLEVYVSTFSLDNNDNELQNQQALFIVQVLCTISPQYLLQSIFSSPSPSKKYLYKFIIALKQDNLIQMFYKVITNCLYDVTSITVIQDIFFQQPGFFNYQFKSIFQEIVNFPLNQSQKHQHKNKMLDAQEQNIFLEDKLCYLLKIIQIIPCRILDFQQIFFNNATISSSKYINLLPQQPQFQQQFQNSIKGSKLCHFIIDSLNYLALKNSRSTTIPKILRCIGCLLKDNSSEYVMMQCMNINHPSFQFIQCQSFNGNFFRVDDDVVTELNTLLQAILNNHKFYDSILIADNNHTQVYSHQSIESRQLELYPFRYSNSFQYKMLLKQYLHLYGNHQTYSSYWITKILQIVEKQCYNPSLINLILEKFIVIPSISANNFNNSPNSNSLNYNSLNYNSALNNNNMSGDSTTSQQYSNNKYGFFVHQYNNSPPYIFQCMVNTVNKLPIWENILKVLSYKLRYRNNRYEVVNKSFTESLDFKNTQHILQDTLILFKNILSLQWLLINYQHLSPQHFILKLISNLKVIYKLSHYVGNIYSSTPTLFKDSTILNNGSTILNGSAMQEDGSSNIVMAILSNISNLHQIVELSNKTFHEDMQWQGLEQQNNTNYIHANYKLKNRSQSNAEQLQNHEQQLMSYMKEHRYDLDFDMVFNIMTPSKNKYYEANSNILMICLEILMLLGQKYEHLNINVAVVDYSTRLAQNYLGSANNASSHESILPNTVLPHALVNNNMKQMSQNIKDNLIQTLTQSLLHSKSVQMRQKIVQFLYFLKYPSSKNYFIRENSSPNAEIADQILQRYIKQAKNFDNNGLRVNIIFLNYLFRQFQNKSLKNQPFAFKTIELMLATFHNNKLKTSNQTPNHIPLKDFKDDLRDVIIHYKSHSYQHLSLYQLQRVIDERNIIQIGESLRGLWLIIRYLNKALLQNKNNKLPLQKYLATVSTIFSKYDVILLELNLPPLEDLFQNCFQKDQNISTMFFNNSHSLSSFTFCKDVDSYTAERNRPNNLQTNSIDEYLMEHPRSYIRDPIQYYLAYNTNNTNNNSPNTTNNNSPYTTNNNSPKNMSAHIRNKLQNMQQMQKINILQWLYHIIYKLSSDSHLYLSTVLTINKYYFANNPIQIQTQNNISLQNSGLFYHLHLGKYAFNAVDIFGKGDDDAINNVSNIAKNVIARVEEYIQNNNNQRCTLSNAEKGIKIIGFCLEWLRGNKKSDDQPMKSMIRRLERKIILMQYPNEVRSEGMVKLLTSIISIQATIEIQLSESTKSKLKEQIYTSLYKYEAQKKNIYKRYPLGLKDQVQMSHQHSFINDNLNSSINYNDNLNSSINYNDMNNNGGLEDGVYLMNIRQQMMALLMIMPPLKEQRIVIEKIVLIWQEQTNYQYFFNQSRIVLQLCEKYPEEVVRYHPLTKVLAICDFINIEDRYVKADGRRSNANLCWIWILKIATTIANHHQFIHIHQEITKFISKYKLNIFNTLNSISNSNKQQISNKQQEQHTIYNPCVLSKAYMEQLNSTLELLCAVFSISIWSNINRELFEQFTYLVTNKTINIFMNNCLNKSKFVSISENEHHLNQIKLGEETHCQNEEGEYEMNEEKGNILDQLSNLHTNANKMTVFQLQMEIKLITAMRNFSIVLCKVMKESNYVEKYFTSSISETVKYSNLYWDKTNKHLLDFIKFCQKMTYNWKRLQKLNQPFILIKDCHHSAETFIQNGYLPAIIDLPSNIDEVYSEIYLLSFLFSQTALIHLIQQRKYMKIHQTLMPAHLDTYAKKLREGINKLMLSQQNLGSISSAYVNQNSFVQLKKCLEELILAK